MKKIIFLLICIISFNAYAQDSRLIDTDTWYIEKITLEGEDYLSPLYGLPLNGISSFTENPNEFLFSYCDGFSTTITYSSDTAFELPVEDPIILLGMCTVQAEVTFDSRFQTIYYDNGNYNGPFTYEINEMGSEKELIVTNSAGDKAYYNTIALSIDENSFANVTIYPNPAKDILTISTTNIENSTVTIYNILGKEVMNAAIDTASQQLNIEHLNAGIYLMNVVAINGKQQTLKFIKE
ncbi:hypothetical protein ULMS_03160 [Patiriisocius marinistellae]|uniref:Secretion system C-terminal sorting domain-containing protein n=1 Tax=Patiriisocius marinistellae TaxID=2494560 RepID=A0A5J4FUI5_9FLAO|nr:T9SS type A sorting domain-containing protein [Patiriisocius marinistellae]GEQ84808.1 hypothetical protein ULMS_03160 [Patiriisocius marinistellae]